MPDEGKSRDEYAPVSQFKYYNQTGERLPFFEQALEEARSTGKCPVNKHCKQFGQKIS
jgi:hypothetical protein